MERTRSDRVGVLLEGAKLRRPLHWLALMGGLILALLLPAPAGAASAGIAVSADPTEDKPVTVTVSGVADTSTRLYVFWYSGTALCPATAASLSYYYELSGTTSYMTDGDGVAAGSYTRPYQLTPSAAGSYRVCAYLATSPETPPPATASQTVTARMPSGSVSIATSTDPTEDKPVTYTVTGTVEVHRRLYMYVLSGSGTACPSSPSDISYYYELSGAVSYYSDGDAVPAGSFSRTYSFVPSDSGGWRACAYVAESSTDQPNATDAQSTKVREPMASVALIVSSDPTEEKPVSVTASGTTEVDRRLYLYVQPGSGNCPPDPSGISYYYELSGTVSYYSDGDAVSAGPYTRTYQFIPDAEGSYRLCAYVGESATDAANAQTVTQLTARNPAAQLDLSISPSEYENGQAMTVAVTAAAEVNRRLFVFVIPDSSGCPATASDNSYTRELTGTVSYYAEGDALVTGQAATRSYSFAASTQHANYRVCAYIGESATDAEKTTSALAVRKPALVGVLVTNNDEKERDHLLLVWRRGSEKERDQVYVYDREPGVASKPLWSGYLDDPALQVSSDGENHRVFIRRHLGYGRFWWRIARTDARGYRVFSEARTVRVVPRQLVRGKARANMTLRLRNSSRRPGTVRLLIHSSPLSKVRLVVRHAGRTVERRAFTEGFRGARTVKFALSCARAGRFAYTLDITDSYGTSVRRRGAWVVSVARCARLKAAERAQAEARRRVGQKGRRYAGGGGSSGGSPGGSVGCDGDPGATPYPQFSGQRDGDHDGCYGES